MKDSEEPWIEEQQCWFGSLHPKNAGEKAVPVASRWFHSILILISGSAVLKYNNMDKKEVGNPKPVGDVFLEHQTDFLHDWDLLHVSGWNICRANPWPQMSFAFSFLK